VANRPTHFEIPVDDPDRAAKFYSAVFGWNVQSFPGSPSYYGLAGTGDTQPGIDGALMQREGGNTATRLTMGVDSIEHASERITAAGGKVTQGKLPIPGMGYFAVCEDTEGNSIGIFTVDPTATM
jgi:predicted enzyme related to lactoylglutathione lyase